MFLRCASICGVRKAYAGYGMLLRTHGPDVLRRGISASILLAGYMLYMFDVNTVYGGVGVLGGCGCMQCDICYLVLCVVLSSFLFLFRIVFDVGVLFALRRPFEGGRV